jgi:hypothetical protein
VLLDLLGLTEYFVDRFDLGADFFELLDSAVTVGEFVL